MSLRAPRLPPSTLLCRTWAELLRAQIDGALGYIAKTRYPLRNRVMFLLSVKAGLHAEEIASVTWDMLVTAEAPSDVRSTSATQPARVGRVG